MNHEGIKKEVQNKLALMIVPLFIILSALIILSVIEASWPSLILIIIIEFYCGALIYLFPRILRFPEQKKTKEPRHSF